MKYKLAKLNDGKNSIEKTWYIYYSYLHPETGKMLRFKKWISNKYKTKSGRRQKAYELISFYNNKLKRGWNPFSDQEIKQTTIKVALDRAMKIKAATINQRSQWTYNSVIKHFNNYLVRKKLHNMPVDEINTPMIQDYFDEMLINETISKRTYNNRLTPLKTLFGLMHRREYIHFNPFLSIEKLRCSDPEITAYTTKELEKIGEVLPKYNYQLYVISQLVYYCFLRPAEIVRLQFKDILFDHGLIVVPGTKSKNKKSQVIIIPDRFKENLKHWDLNYPDDYYLFSRNLKPGTFLVAPTRIAGKWREFADKHGIKKGIYDFKHTGNGLAFDQGFNARDIQLQNRHSSLDETQKYLNKFRRIASDRFKEEFTGY